MHHLTRTEIDPNGCALVEAYMVAMRRRVEFTPAPSPLVRCYFDCYGFQVDHWPFDPIAERMLAQLHLLRCEEETAHDDLWWHVRLHGPVETAIGVWRLDGSERLVFRRRDHPPIPHYGREPCPN